MLDLSSLPETESFSLPPVHLWSPPFCGDMDLLIKANGDWIHEGSKIKREKMVNLFSRILWFEDGDYFLVTPVEKVRIQVEDAPFLITQWRYIETEQGTAIEFTSLTHDVVILGVDCDIWMAPFMLSQAPSHNAQKTLADPNETSEERPYISMRYGMKAMLHRNVFYGLVEHLQPVSTEQGNGLGLVSADKSYLLMRQE